MDMASLPDLVQLGTYSHHEDAERVRGFLLNSGIVSVLVQDHLSTLADAPTQYGLMVPPADAVKALGLMAQEDRIDSETGSWQDPYDGVNRV